MVLGPRIAPYPAPTGTICLSNHGVELRRRGTERLPMSPSSTAFLYCTLSDESEEPHPKDAYPLPHQLRLSTNRCPLDNDRITRSCLNRPETTKPQRSRHCPTTTDGHRLPFAVHHQPGSAHCVRFSRPQLVSAPPDPRPARNRFCAPRRARAHPRSRRQTKPSPARLGSPTSGGTSALPNNPCIAPRAISGSQTPSAESSSRTPSEPRNHPSADLPNCRNHDC